MPADLRPAVIASLLAGVLALAACASESNSSPDEPASSGGASTGGASTGTAGASTGTGATGGVPATGGIETTGGTSATGGIPATGGIETTGGTPATGGEANDFELAPTTAVTFTSTSEDFNNPERGFYQSSNVVNETSYDRVYADGYTLVYSYIRLDDYRDAAIPQSLFDDLETGLDAARAAGVKLILRFAYNFGPYPDSEPDAPKARVLEHIAQAAPYLAEHEDVIAAMQAGFIGAWGEWHTSTNGLDNVADKQDILEALLDATPASRTVHVRYPPDKEAMYGGPLTVATAFDGSYAARTGHHNDCFLSSDTDVGTYPSNAIEQYKTYLEEETKFVPIGGETCAVDARGTCAIATAEMARLHYSYLNRDYHTDVIDGWISGGCYDAIKRSLGYRLELSQASVPTAARPGGAFLLEVQLTNVGYAAPFNPRPLQVALVGGNGVARATVAGIDPRRWLPDAPIALRIEVRLPSDLDPGDYELGLALPDAATSIEGRPEYAIRFANDGTWDATTGVNALGTLHIDDSAPGDATADAATLTAAVGD
jgi:hypothetical protein